MPCQAEDAPPHAVIRWKVVADSSPSLTKTYHLPHIRTEGQPIYTAIMPDLNELLKWSIANSTPKGDQHQQNAADEPLSLRFNPPSHTPPTGSSALHPSDPLYGSASSALAAAPHYAQPTPTPSHSALNSEILETIMGKPDSTVMKEKMDFALDESRPVDERVEALDDFEMVCTH